MQGFTQQSRMHPVATQAMQRGTGGMHQPGPARPAQGAPAGPMPTLARPAAPRAQQVMQRPSGSTGTVWQQLLEQYLRRMQGGQ